VSWVNSALDALEGAGQEGIWGYHPGGAPFAEPTALATLALVAHQRPPASRHLASIQQTDGAVGLSAKLAFPRWPTPLAILAWLADEGEPERIARACDYLLTVEGATFPNDDTVGQNTEIVGWPWVAETHSWLEPTSYCLIALGLAGHGTHARVQEGQRLILDRICAGGGWNYGCPAQLGNAAQAFPAPTGIALLALRDRRDDTALASSVRFLASRVSATRSPVSLSWGLLGLAAAERLPAKHETWLEESFGLLQRRGFRVLEAALLLLAAQPGRALELISVDEEGR